MKFITTNAGTERTFENKFDTWDEVLAYLSPPITDVGTTLTVTAVED